MFLATQESRASHTRRLVCLRPFAMVVEQEGHQVEHMLDERAIFQPWRRAHDLGNRRYGKSRATFVGNVEPELQP